MKLTVLIIVALIASVAQSKFHKKVFLDFPSIIEHVNSVQKNWVAGHNKYFDGMDLETIKGMMGTL